MTADPVQCASYKRWDIPNRENERACPERAFEESPPAYIFDLPHAISPAASLIA
jgi:hypothetical protein